MRLMFVFLVLSLCFLEPGIAQKKDSFHLYNPEANASKDIDSVLAKAKIENKQIWIQVGGNWCVWCIRLHQFIENNTDVKRKIAMDYVVYYLNYSTENTNKALLTRFKHPERFGFPVILVLDYDGNLLHTQDTGLLEENMGYNKQKIYDLIKNWTVRAVAGK